MNRNALRTRLREINIEHTRLLRDKSAPGRFELMAALRSERAILVGLLTGEGALRLVSKKDRPAAHRQSP